MRQSILFVLFLSSVTANGHLRSKRNVLFPSGSGMGSSVTALNDSSRSKRSVLFPYDSGMEIYLALAVPLDLPQYEISMSFNYEANYILPTNATELALGPQYTEIRKARHITREKFYSYVEQTLEKQGLLGKPCLLRTICETQANPIFGHNGLIGDLIHILFTPSSTSQENISNEYGLAEENGLKGTEDCARIYSDCPIDLYDLFTIWSH